MVRGVHGFFFLCGLRLVVVWLAIGVFHLFCDAETNETHRHGFSKS